MNCPDVERLLHPYADGELDLVRHVEIEEHLAGCAACAEREKNLRSLRACLSSGSLYHRAPAGLRERVGTAAASAPFAPVRRRAPVRLAGMAAGVLLLIGASAIIGIFLSQAGASSVDRLADSVVEAHIRSLQVDHLTDIGSSDRHTVKPWFRGKLDFSPQVPDFSAQGYALTGGRLDYLAGRPVAALVYHRRLHTINLFTWPTSSEDDKAVRGLARQGFHIRYWQRSGMTYWAVSDLNEQELDELVRLIQEHSSEMRP